MSIANGTFFKLFFVMTWEDRATIWNWEINSSGGRVHWSRSCDDGNRRCGIQEDVGSIARP